jgi:hypothetical protein
MAIVFALLDITRLLIDESIGCAKLM